MKLQFSKGPDFGPYAEHIINLASCERGSVTHAAIKEVRELTKLMAIADSQSEERPELNDWVIRDQVRGILARILETDAANITVFTGGTPEGIAIVKNGLGVGNGDKVALHGSEFATPYRNLGYYLQDWTPVYISGERDSRRRPLGFSLEELERVVVHEGVKLVVISHVQSSNAFTIDLARAAVICRHNEVPLIIDATQSIGTLPLNPGVLGVDAVVAPLWTWIGGSYASAFLYTDPLLRGKFKANGLNRNITKPVWIRGPHRDEGALTNGSQFDSEWADPVQWSRNRNMLRVTEDYGIAAIRAENTRLLAIGRDILSTPRIEFYEPPFEASPGSFLAFALKDPFYGRESEVVERVFAHPRRICITSCSGFIRLAPNHFIADEEMITACEVVRDTVNAL